MSVLFRSAVPSLVLVLAFFRPAPACGEFKITAELLESTIRKVVPLVEKATGTSLTGQVSFRLARADEIRAILEKELIPQYRTVYEDPATATATARQFSAHMSEFLLGKFVSDGGEILICPENFTRVAKSLGDPALNSEGVLRIVLVHEFAHAAAEKRYRFSRTLRTRSGADQIHAYSAVLEGHAQVIARKISVAEGWQKEFETYTDSIGKTPPDMDEALRLMGRVIAANFESAYSQGERFMKAIAEKGGEAAVERAFTDPPTDLEVIFHPAWFLDSKSRPRLEYEFEGALDFFSKTLDSKTWGATRVTASSAQLRAALSLLPAEDVDRVLKNLRQNRMAVLTEKLNPQNRLVVGALYEFSSPLEAVFYLAAAEKLGRVKDKKMADGGIRITGSSYRELKEKSWQGLYFEKKVVVGLQTVPVFSLIAVKGSLVVELLYSNASTSRRELVRIAGQLFEKTVKRTGPGDESPPPRESP